jgi:hypothetical protein
VSQKSILCDVYFITLNDIDLIIYAKLVTDQWRASLGVRDSESCWFMEEICTYMRCWESPGDLPLVIEIVVSFRSFRCAPLAKRHKISITRGRSPGLSQEHM